MCITGDRCRFAAPGFHLVELMVVLALVVLLIAMLMPALARARKSSRQIHCFANLRQLHMAHMNYAADNKGRNCFTRMGNGETTVWTMQFLRPYVPMVGRWRTSNQSASVKNSWSGRDDVYYCPEDPKDRDRFSTTTSASYFMHARWGACQTLPVVRLQVHRLQTMQRPTKLLLLTCKSPSIAVQGVGWASYIASTWHLDPDASAGLFLDGHVRPWRYSEWPDHVELPPSGGTLPGSGCP